MNNSRIVVFKRTADDWFSNYKIEGDARVSDLVEVSFLKTGGLSNIGEWRVCIWGNDDMGMERDYTDDEAGKVAALAMFMKVISWKFVDIVMLNDEGFVNA
jgi:hypothetical protein